MARYSTNLKNLAPLKHDSADNTYGLGTTANYGHVKTINALTQASHEDGTALSAYQGKVLKDSVDSKISKATLLTEFTFTGTAVDLTSYVTSPLYTEFILEYESVGNISYWNSTSASSTSGICLGSTPTTEGTNIAPLLAFTSSVVISSSTPWTINVPSMYKILKKVSVRNNSNTEGLAFGFDGDLLGITAATLGKVFLRSFLAGSTSVSGTLTVKLYGVTI